RVGVTGFFLSPYALARVAARRHFSVAQLTAFVVAPFVDGAARQREAEVLAGGERRPVVPFAGPGRRRALHARAGVERRLASFDFPVLGQFAAAFFGGQPGERTLRVAPPAEDFAVFQACERKRRAGDHFDDPTQLLAVGAPHFRGREA